MNTPSSCSSALKISHSRDSSGEAIVSLEGQLMQQKAKYHKFIEYSKNVLAALQAQLQKDRQEVEGVLEARNKEIDKLKKDKNVLLKKLAAKSYQNAQLKRKLIRYQREEVFFQNKKKEMLRKKTTSGSSKKRKRTPVLAVQKLKKLRFKSKTNVRRRKLNDGHLLSPEIGDLEIDHANQKANEWKMKTTERPTIVTSFKGDKHQATLFPDKNDVKSISSSNDDSETSPSEKENSIIKRKLDRSPDRNSCSRQSSITSSKNSQSTSSRQSSSNSVNEAEELKSDCSDAESNNDEVFDNLKAGHESKLRLDNLIDTVEQLRPIETSFKKNSHTMSESDTSTVVMQTTSAELTSRVVEDRNSSEFYSHSSEEDDQEIETESDTYNSEPEKQIQSQKESQSTVTSSSSDFENISLHGKEEVTIEVQPADDELDSSLLAINTFQKNDHLSSSFFADSDNEKNGNENADKQIQRKSTLRRSSAIRKKSTNK